MKAQALQQVHAILKGSGRVVDVEVEKEEDEKEVKQPEE